MVFGVDEEDDAAYFGEVIFPEAAGFFVSDALAFDFFFIICFKEREVGGTLLMTTEIKSGEAIVSNGQLLGCCSFS